MNEYILGLDVGDARVGVALAHTIARLPSPYAIYSPAELLENIAEIVQKESVGLIVVGLPESLHGTDNTQMVKIKAYIDAVREQVATPIVFVDEAHTSVDAKAFAAQDKKLKQRQYIDDIAACYIIEEYIKGVV